MSRERLPRDPDSEAVLKTLLLTDLVSSTKLVEELGDRRSFEVLGRHDEVARALLEHYDGREIDKTDGFLLLFARPVDAVRYALAYHRALDELASQLELPLAARAGIHLGEVYLRANPADAVARGAKPIEVEGLAKPAAARIMSLGGGRQTLLTQGAFELARRAARDADINRLDLEWLEHGKYAFKGISDPVRVFEVGERGFAPLAPPPDSAKVRRVVDAQAGPGASPARLTAGTVLGRYCLEQFLAAGGMGEVYRALDTELERQVAVKVLPREVAADRDRLSRFRREARSLAAVSHPNIVEIYDFGTADGVSFAVEELLEGRDLRKELARGALSWRRSVSLIAAAADGLAAAHARGVIHRDIKPENIFVTADERVKILDFGLARIDRVKRAGDGTCDTDSLLTGAGAVLGTVGYLAPEQVRGQTADHRADIFSLGCVLHEMLTGQRTFRRDTAADTMAAILNEPPSALEHRISGEAPALSRIVQRCLAKDAGDRYQSAAELAAELRSLLDPSTASDTVATESIVVSPGSRPAARAPRTRLFVGAGLALLLVVVASAIAWFLRSSSGTIAEPGDAALPRIAVLPFDNLGAEDDAFFAAGMSDEITGRLAAVSRLRVVTPGAGHRSATDYREIASALGVDYVLAGTVRWNRRLDGPQQVRITPKLIRASDGNLMWAQPFDRLLEDIFEVQSDIAGRVLSELDVALLGRERQLIDARPTANMEAYQAYLRGLYHTGSLIEEELYAAVANLERAITLDPDFALAHAELAVVHSNLYTSRVDASEARLDAAEAAARRALEIEPELGRAHLARAVHLAVGKKDRPGALTELETALRVNPNDGRVLLWQARLLAMEGRPQESYLATRSALEMDPTSYQAQSTLGGSLLTLKRYAEADSAFERAIELQPDRLDAYIGRFWNALVWENGTTLARQVLDSVPQPRHRDIFELRLFALFIDDEFERALELIRELPADGVASSNWRWNQELLACHAHLKLGHTAEARSCCERSRDKVRTDLGELPEDPRLWVVMGYSLAVLGERDEAIRAAEKALAEVAGDATQEYQFLLDLAAVSAIAGDPERAIDTLEEMFARPIVYATPRLLTLDWRFDSLHGNPRFQKLVNASTGPS